MFALILQQDYFKHQKLRVCTPLQKMWIHILTQVCLFLGLHYFYDDH